MTPRVTPADARDCSPDRVLYARKYSRKPPQLPRDSIRNHGYTALGRDGLAALPDTFPSPSSATKPLIARRSRRGNVVFSASLAAVPLAARYIRLAHWPGHPSLRRRGFSRPSPGMTLWPLSDVIEVISVSGADNPSPTYLGPPFAWSEAASRPWVESAWVGVRSSISLSSSGPRSLAPPQQSIRIPFSPPSLFSLLLSPSPQQDPPCPVLLPPTTKNPRATPSPNPRPAPSARPSRSRPPRSNARTSPREPAARSPRGKRAVRTIAAANEPAREVASGRANEGENVAASAPPQTAPLAAWSTSTAHTRAAQANRQANPLAPLLARARWIAVMIAGTTAANAGPSPTNGANPAEAIAHRIGAPIVDQIADLNAAQIVAQIAPTTEAQTEAQIAPAIATADPTASKTAVIATSIVPQATVPTAAPANPPSHSTNPAPTPWVAARAAAASVVAEEVAVAKAASAARARTRA